MQGKILIIILVVVSFIKLQAQTPAHEKSGFAIVDLMYNPYKEQPETNLKSDGVPWIYGPSELECWRLQVLQQRKDSAKLLVGYPGVFHRAYTTGSFHLKLNKQKVATTINCRVVGNGNVFVNNKLVYQFSTTDSVLSIPLPPNELVDELRFDISTSAEPPALLILKGLVSTANPSWEWKAESENWQPAFKHLQTLSGIAPHLLDNPEVVLKPEKRDGQVYDFGCELFGHIWIRSLIKPKISVGESKYEASDTINKVLEQSTEMVLAEKGLWKSKSLMAFRYVYADVKNEDIQCNAVFYPVRYKGAFACSDSMLTRIWMNSAYTLRLCMHDFLIDGIKRDRLPWAGDLAMSMMADAYTFGDAEIVRRSLNVLGRAGIKEKDINGIIDYSLWWVIAQYQYQLYFGDKEHLKREWPRIKETLDLLSARCDSSGFLIPRNNWLFIDWVKQEKWTALQILWWWAQQSGEKLAYSLGDTKTAIHWKNISGLLQKELETKAWSEDKAIWLANPALPDMMSKHPNFLAVISGLASKNQYEPIHRFLLNKDVNPVGTPYMAGFENLVLARLGDIDSMIAHVNAYWGGMIQQGATTFWEAYDQNQVGKEAFSFYDRPYGKSLCHAWSAGPAAFLPSEIFGLYPLENGWKRFSVNPNLGSLKWASATVPTPLGDIVIEVNQREMTLSIPAEATAEWKGKLIKGPQILKDNF